MPDKNKEQENNVGLRRWIFMRVWSFPSPGPWDSLDSCHGEKGYRELPCKYLGRNNVCIEESRLSSRIPSWCVPFLLSARTHGPTDVTSYGTWIRVYTESPSLNFRHRTSVHFFSALHPWTDGSRAILSSLKLAHWGPDPRSLAGFRDYCYIG